MMPRAVLFGLLVMPNQTLAEPAGDPARGEGLFRQCVACHQVGPDAANRVGPHLNHIFDRPAGAAEGFRYSPAMQDAAAAGLHWDNATLDAFLEDPKGVVEKTRMSFRGLADAQDRQDLIAYLHLFSDQVVAETVSFTVSADILSMTGDAAYGEYLSGDCTSCHQLSGATAGIPGITGLSREGFVTAMHAYKAGAREHPVMQMMAGRLSNEEIAALAAYFEDVN